MNKSVAIQHKDFEKAASKITAATDMLIVASLCLRASFIMGKKHDELSGIRTDVYKRARLYDSKIMPFATDAVMSIQEFCSGPLVNKDYNFFKRFLKTLIKDARLNMKLCEYTVIFHKTILTEFKTIEDEAILLKKKLGLDEKEYREKKKLVSFGKNDWAAGLALIPEIKSLILPILGKENKQIPELDKDSLEIAAIDAMDPLMKSIQSYTESLSTITGFFNILYHDLTTINEKIQKNFSDDEGEYYYEIIKGKAGDVSNACGNYIGKVPECSSNINCIKEDYDKSFADNWIFEVIRNENKHSEIKDLIGESRLLMLYGKA